MITLLMFLLIAMAAIWVRGELEHDAIVLNIDDHMVIIGSFPHHIAITEFRDDNYHGQWARLLLNEPFVHPMGIFWQLRCSFDPNMLELDIPWWVPALLLLAMLARGCTLHARAFRRRLKNECPTCGYDVRATLNRCPECGMIEPLRLPEPASQQSWLRIRLVHLRSR
jgi:hypothetical protein